MSDCEKMAEWLSARRDGELSEEHGLLLERHLVNCPACRALDAGFARVDRWFGAEGAAPRDGFEARVRDLLELEAPDPSDSPSPSSRSRMRSRALVIRWTSLAAAVLLMAILIPTFLLTGDKADAGIALPLATLEAIHEERRQGHRAMMKTFEYELRALKLEIDCMELDEPERAALLGAVERLSGRVLRARSNPGGP